MDNHDRYTIAKGFIDGKDKDARPIYGLFLAVAFGKELVYLAERFSHELIDRNISWAEMVGLLNSQPDESREESLAQYEKELRQYVEMSRLFQSDSSVLDAKAIEHKITYFCSDILAINAITFLELTALAKDDLVSLMPFLKNDGTGVAGEDARPEYGDEEEEHFFEESTAHKERKRDLFVSCEPVLDPVRGIAVSDLSVGDSVSCRLSHESVYYKFFKGRFPDFDGVITGEVTGIKVSEDAPAVVALDLVDGIAGIMKISGKVRISLAEKHDSEETENGSERSVEVILAGASVILFLCLLGVLLYILS